VPQENVKVFLERPLVTNWLSNKAFLLEVPTQAVEA
jgi:hypothetical protein